MLCRAIRQGSKIYHEDDPFNYVGLYDSFMRTTTLDLHRGHGENSVDGVRKAIRFLNQWRTRYQSSERELFGALHDTWDALRLLRQDDIFGIDFGEPREGRTTSEIIRESFERIARCGRRYERTGTSKILHLLQPHLFVMWDNAIARGYGFRANWEYGSAGEGPAWDYAYRFLPRMQLLARRAVNEHVQHHEETPAEAIRGLCCCGHTLAMVLNEYNYVKFTANHEEVWRTEFSS